MPHARSKQATQTSQPADLVGFYDHAYSESDPLEAARYARWRELGAVGKAEHAIDLCARAGIDPDRTLEVGCGDGALLAELHRRGFGGRLCGVEITRAAVQIAGGRTEIDSVECYDGSRLPFADGAFELGVVSHVLEHVPEPQPLLREIARACGAVLVEVPLEANVSAQRSSKRAHAAEVGHLQRLSRADVHELVRRAGLRIVAELDDALPLAVHTFFATSPPQRARATAKWSLRASAHRIAPALARRLFTVHYACLCVPVA